uniref:C2H2-type domain-containing protein n=1 Tax=Leptobrachium leishanense TaxID=445787 RepID=A0A8C5QQJ0_9ANUR
TPKSSTPFFLSGLHWDIRVPAGERLVEIYGTELRKLLYPPQEYRKSPKMSSGIAFKEPVPYVEENIMKSLPEEQEEIMINDEALHSSKNPKEADNPGLSSRTFLCPDRMKCLSTNGSLGKPRRVHVGEKPFACSECEKCFRTKGHLTPFACSECDIFFRTKGNLTVHERIYTGEKRFACSECEKCFRAKGELTKHERIHTGEKPFVCSECERCCKSKRDLTVHERVHTGEKPFACSECGKGFGRKRDSDQLFLVFCCFFKNGK